MAINIVGYK